ncbi:LysR substrate-binding domain-containing protein [Oharaeibacter diazotrophicus]|uniref:DNA-binding transcriptional LysR family regulator n=1 Tax=Oharaeibacter diazotrophicus TaxID=1920512 RepID=A0A4R6RBQ5_9HYPH|nr:LysR substrate-binding domain-containing protein [Oharaeibacter diazotrophicus]TDP83499.1 DNA-binding transcriptional LysR family regulator [Oharaeibacter diazotrophicus]BBE72332.1 HTH-type transcriptional regulator GltC [Pleomorphomonas sp. SM30]GLS79102.1 LysR family transcriptional regulator [Oharaeibacter diazotrophicus]
MNVLDLDQLRTFLAIAEIGSFTAAADVVHKTQSAVSMQMRRLEERVGRPIFTRDGRQSRLTEDGRRLLEYARRMIRLNDETLAAFSDPGLTGSIRLGLPDDYADRLLPTVLAGFSRINPMIEIAVECQPTRTVHAMIREGELDLGIITHGEAGDIRGDLIRREPLYWVSARDHCTHELDPVPLALGPDSCCWRSQAVRALDGVGRRFRIAYTSGHAMALSGAVLAGLAVSVLPESAIRMNMRILGPRDGFPDLAAAEIALIRADHAKHSIHDALATHIATSLGNLGAATNPLPIAAE